MLAAVAYATGAAIICLKAFVILLFVEGKAAYGGSWTDRVFNLLVCGFFVSVLTAQLLLASNLHLEPIGIWHLVGLYFTAVIVFFSLIFIAVDIGCDVLRLTSISGLPDRLVEASVATFLIGWIVQIILLLTR